MIISKVITSINNHAKALQTKKAKTEELAQDMADWLPPYGYGIHGKIARRAVQIIKQREKEAQNFVEEKPKMLSGAFMDILEGKN